jgi:hypothetical protein
MGIDPLDIVESAKPEQPRLAWLNPAVAITVAILATFLGICKVKDDNIVQGMQQAQADKIDHWAYYQARNIREEIAKATLVQLKILSIAATSAQLPLYQQQISSYEALARDQAKKKDEVKAQAEADQKTYDALNFRDDQFDLSDACIAIAISLLAVASLTQLPWLFALALLPSAFGFVMGVAGLGSFSLHPQTLIQLLS